MSGFRCAALVGGLLLGWAGLVWAGPFDPPVGIQDEGGTETKPVYTLNCTGAGIVCSHSGITGTLTVGAGVAGNPAGADGQDQY